MTDKFSRAEVKAICSNLAQDYADVFRFACITGIRKGQLLATTKTMVDPEHWSITWPKAVCKKREPHTIHLTGEVLEIVQRRYEAYPEQPLLFHHDGKPIRDIRYPLKKAFAAAGVSYGRRTGKVFHGSRRTASTNFSQVVDRSVAKSITGHSSDSMYERYCLPDADAQRAALDQAASYVAKQPKRAKVLRFPKKGVA